MKERILKQLKEETESLNVLLETLNENPTHNALNNFNKKLNEHRRMLNESEFLFKNSKDLCELKSELKNFEKQEAEIKKFLTKPMELNFINEDSKIVNRNIDDLLFKASSNFENLKAQGNVLKLGNDTHNSIDKQLEMSLNKLKLIYSRIKNDKYILYLILFIIFALIIYAKFY